MGGVSAHTPMFSPSVLSRSVEEKQHGHETPRPSKKTSPLMALETRAQWERDQTAEEHQQEVHTLSSRFF